MTRLISLLFSCSLLGLSACAADPSTCEVGALGCPCSESGACFGALTCANTGEGMECVDSGADASQQDATTQQDATQQDSTTSTTQDTTASDTREAFEGWSAAGTDNCIGTSDQTFLQNPFDNSRGNFPSGSDAVQDAAFYCFLPSDRGFDDDRVACMKGPDTGITLSDLCLGCYDVLMDCGTNRCAIKCIDTINNETNPLEDPECGPCLLAECITDFNLCMGNP